MPNLLVFIPPSGDLVHGVTLAALERAVVAESAKYWLQGSFDSAIEFYDHPVKRGSFGEQKSRILLLPVAGPELKFVVLAEQRDRETLHLVAQAPSDQIVVTQPGDEPWRFFAHHAIDRASTWNVVEAFCSNGDVPAAPNGHEWLTESAVTLPDE